MFSYLAITANAKKKLTVHPSICPRIFRVSLSAQSEPAKTFWKSLGLKLKQNPDMTAVHFIGQGILDRKDVEVLIHNETELYPGKVCVYVRKLQSLPLSLTNIDDEGFTGYHVAAVCASATNVFRIYAGATLEQQDKKGRTAMQLAAYLGNVEVVKSLWCIGAKLEFCTKRYGSPQALAHEGGDKDTEAFIATKIQQRSKYLSEFQKSVVKGSPNFGGNKSKFLPELATSLFMIKHTCEEGSKEVFNKVTLLSGNADFVKAYYRYETALRHLSHSWKIDWDRRPNELPNFQQCIYYEGSYESLQFNPHDGGFASYFLRQMAKGTHAYTQMFSNDFTKAPPLLDQLEELYFLASGQVNGSTVDMLKRYRQRKPLLIHIFFCYHIVAVLIWHGHFIICNRGQAFRKAVEVFCFKPANLKIAHLNKMVASLADEEAYKRLFFEELPDELEFSQSHIETELESMLTLPPQFGPNCSWESSETAGYAFMAFKNLRTHYQLIAESFDSPVAQALVDTSFLLFTNWLVFQQLRSVDHYEKVCKNSQYSFSTNYDMLDEIKDKIKFLLSRDWVYPEIKQKLISTYDKLA